MKRFLLVLSILMSFAACGGGGGGSSQAGTAALQGIVKDSNGTPIEGATVTAGSGSTTTNSLGYFELTALTEGDAVAVRASATGKTPAVKSVALQNDVTVYQALVLSDVGASDTINVAAGGTVTDDATGAAITIDAGTLSTSVKTRGLNGDITVIQQQVTGDVTLSVTAIDPTTAAGVDLFPGGWENDQGNALESYGAITCTIEQGGSEIEDQFQGTARIAIPESKVATAPDTMPLWALNETTGLWEETGTLSKVDCGVGTCYEGSVTHCSSWNADVEVATPIEVGGTIVGPEEPPTGGGDGESAALACAYQFKVILENGTELQGSANTDGTFSGNAPASQAITIKVCGTSGSCETFGPFTTGASGTLDVGTLTTTLSACQTVTPENYLAVILTWDSESMANLDLHAIVPLADTDGSSHLYFDEAGDFSVDPFATLTVLDELDPELESAFEEAGLDPTEFVTNEEVFLSDRFTPGTYFFVVHNRSGSPITSALGAELTYSFVHVSGSDFNAESNTLAIGEGDSLSTDGWRVLQMTVDEAGTFTVTEVTGASREVDISDPSDASEFDF